MKKVVVVLILSGLFLVATVKLFGTTVSSKFNNANTAIAPDVLFGEGLPGDYHRPSPARHRGDGTVARPLEANLTVEQGVSTFAVDVDTGSYTLARRILREGALPDPDTVRPEEFVNAFRYDYPVPEPGKTARVVVDGAPSPFDPSKHLLRIGLQATTGEPRQVHLTFLVDTSGSMQGDDRLGLAQRSILTAAERLGPRDTIAIVTYAGSAEVVLESTPANDRRAIATAVARLASGGGTAMGEGMVLAYRQAVRHVGPGVVSRVVVMSDGDANIGHSGPDEILDEIRAWTEEGVTVSTVGFGMGNYRDRMMEQIADRGNGNYQYIDSELEMRRVFSTGLDAMLQVVAKDVKVQVEFDPEVVRSWRLVGYRNRVLENHEFRDDRVDAGELGSGHQVTAFYEVELVDSRPAALLGSLRFRHKREGSWRAEEVEFPIRRGQLASRIGDTSRDFRFQAALAVFAERLAGHSDVSWGWVVEVAEDAAANRPDRLELVELVRRARVIEARL